jgi:hypothetical protein
LSGQRCRNHEDRADSTTYRKPAEHNLSDTLDAHATRAMGESW